MNLSLIFYSLLCCGLLIICFQAMQKIQNKINNLWFNPMLMTIIITILSLHTLHIEFTTFAQYSDTLNWLLEPAIVALGFPLYQQIKSIKKEFLMIVTILTLAITITLTISFVISMWFINNSEITLSLTLKSITTPIGLALTHKFDGLAALTTLTITIAGLTGAIVGIKWLNFLNITSPKAQSLAIGCGSHALGTTSISKISSIHSAYASLSLVLSALITAFIAPVLIPMLSKL